MINKVAAAPGILQDGKSVGQRFLQDWGFRRRGFVLDRYSAKFGLAWFGSGVFARVIGILCQTRYYIYIYIDVYMSMSLYLQVHVHVHPNGLLSVCVCMYVSMYVSPPSCTLLGRWECTWNHDYETRY